MFAKHDDATICTWAYAISVDGGHKLLEKVVLVIHICHAIAVVVVLWCLSPIATPGDALLTFNNGGNVSSLQEIERDSERADGELNWF